MTIVTYDDLSDIVKVNRVHGEVIHLFTQSRAQLASPVIILCVYTRLPVTNITAQWRGFQATVVVTIQHVANVH